MTRWLREFRLVPLVLIAVGCLFALKALGLVFDGGYTLGQRLGRTDTIVVRAETTGEPAVTARLLDRHGMPLTDVPVKSGAGVCELTLTLGNLGAGDYVIELSANGTSGSTEQYLAFRVLR